MNINSDFKQFVEKKNILLSVLIISYNNAEYLPEAINSILNQHYSLENIEIICGDDGSNDGSIELLENYSLKLQNFQYFIMKREDAQNYIPSIRVSNIIRSCIAKARGKYILCLSSDDYLCDMNRFNIQLEYLETHPNVVASVSGFKKVWDDGKEIIYKNIKTSYPNWLFWGSEYIHISAFIFRKEICENRFLLPHFCDDTGLIYTLTCKGRWHFEPEIMFAYRQKYGSIMYNADKLERYLLELNLFEDCIEVGKFKLSNIARFGKPLLFCFKHRKKIKNIKYYKYLEMSEKSNFKIVKKLSMSTNSKLLTIKIMFRLLLSIGIYVMYRILRKIYHVNILRN